nr:hypothetical protein [Tanacetum cinerariifolium]
MNMSQDRKIQNVGGNVGNQFGQYAGQVAHNQQWYNAWQNGIANQNGTGNVVYNTDKDIFSTYGDVVTLKRGRGDKEKDEDSSARLDRGTKKRKSSKDADPSKGLKSKESKSSSSSKGIQSQHKSSSMSTQAEEPEFEAADTEMHQD